MLFAFHCALPVGWPCIWLYAPKQFSPPLIPYLQPASLCSVVTCGKLTLASVHVFEKLKKEY